jgi:hypothetical protein
MSRRVLKRKLFSATLALLCLALGAHRATAYVGARAGASSRVARTATKKPAPAPQTRVEGELLIKVDKGTAGAMLSAAHARVGARVVEEFPSLGWQRVKLPKGLGVEEAIKLYLATPGVTAAQPNYVYHIDDTVPNDTRYGELYGMTKIGAPAAWDLTTGSASVVVAVIDTGIKYTHEDLAANIWTNPGETGTDAQGHDKASNGVDDDGDGFIDDVHGYDFDHNDPDPSDDNGHGTHCAGTIGAVGNNSTGVVGVNWNVSLIAVKTHDSAGNSTSAKVVAAFNYVTMLRARGTNIRVTSNSWGGAPEAGGFDQALLDAIDAAGAANILNVFAAGNANTNIDAQPFYPASYNVPNLISVAASDQSDSRASFSNYGATSVDLAAPGVQILSTSNGNAPNNYVVLSGTSMATPHVAGAAALLAAYNPQLSASSLKATLLNSVDQLAQWSGKTLTGGRLNVARSLQTPTACAFSTDEVSFDFAAPGGNASITVRTSANCDWSAKTDAPWISLAAAGASGGGTLSFTVDPNSGAQRQSAITVAGHDLFVRQDSGCTFTITPASLATFSAAGGQGSVTMTTGTTCSWTATSLASWLTITQGASGTGTGTINFTVAANADTHSRTGQILHTSDSFYAITQAGAPAPPGQVIISEFRIDGAAGAADEFYEIYNTTSDPVVVSTLDGSVGWALAAFLTSGGATFTRVVCTIPNGATIPARGHYLCANNFTDASGVARGYSLADYGGTNRAAPDTATNGAGFGADGVNTIFAGLGLYRSNTDFSNANRLDAVGTSASVFGFAGEGQPINYRGEYNTAAQYSWVRKVSNGVPQDTNDNASDFVLVSTDAATFGGVQSMLGAPGPENSLSPIQRNASFKSSLVDPRCSGTGVGKSGCQNAVRDTTSTGAQATLGTLSIRRRFRNSTSATVSALRFRVIEITTLDMPPADEEHADLRVLSSPDATVRTSDGSQLTIKGAILETPPAQALGGGLNSSLILALSASPLAPGATVDVQFLLGVMREGKYRFVVQIESLP